MFIPCIQDISFVSVTAHDDLEFSLYIVSLILTNTSKDLMAVLQVYVQGAMLVMHINVSAIEFIPRFNDIMHDFWLPPFTNAWCHCLIEVVRMLVLGVLA